MTGELSASPDVAATLGVEEEYHVVDPETYELRDEPILGAGALAGRLDPRLHPEVATTQLEAVTPVCHTLADIRAELVANRRAAAEAAASVGATILVASTHPTGSWTDQRLTARPRYIELYERWGLLALQHGICGCHVHVAVPDLGTAVAVMDRARPYLPVILALTGSSPFHEGVDTGYESYRTQWSSRWAITGPTEPFGDAATYEAVVEGLRRAGAVRDSSNLYWDVRPSAQHPTIEFRVADVCTSIDDAVLVGALLRALTATLAHVDRLAEPAPEVRPELLRAARWRAARDGITGELFDPVRIELVEATAAVERLMAELEPELEARGELHEVADLTAQLLARGTSATRQRAVLHRTADEREVAAFLVGEGLAGC